MTNEELKNHAKYLRQIGKGPTIISAKCLKTYIDEDDLVRYKEGEISGEDIKIYEKGEVYHNVVKEYYNKEFYKPINKEDERK